MGNIIRPSAAAADIFKDARTSYNNATARGGVAVTLADQMLSPVIKVADNIEGQIKTVTASAETVIAALAAANDHADDLFQKVADEIWNDVGRPAADPYLSVLLPGGSSFYVDGDVAEQPDKMMLFVELLRADIHPRLAKADAEAAALKVETEAGVLRAAVDAAQAPRTKLQLLGRVHAALSRVAALQIAAYKRMLKASGFSEADVHKIIPDHPRPEAKGTAAPTDPAAKPAKPADPVAKPVAPAAPVASPATPAPAAPVASPATPTPATPVPTPVTPAPADPVTPTPGGGG